MTHDDGAAGAEVIELALSLKIQHDVCDDDCWYSCPKSNECCNDQAPDRCTCGAEAHNARVDELIVRLRSALREPPPPHWLLKKLRFALDEARRTITVDHPVRLHVEGAMTDIDFYETMLAKTDDESASAPPEKELEAFKAYRPPTDQPTEADIEPEGASASAPPEKTEHELAEIAIMLVGLGINGGGPVRDGVRELGRQFQMMQQSILVYQNDIAALRRELAARAASALSPEPHVPTPDSTGVFCVCGARMADVTAHPAVRLREPEAPQEHEDGPFETIRQVIASLRDVVSVGRFAAAVDPTRFCSDLALHLESAISELDPVAALRASHEGRPETKTTND